VHLIIKITSNALDTEVSCHTLRLVNNKLVHHEPSQSWNRQASAKSRDVVSIRWWCPEKTSWKATFWAGGKRCIQIGVQIESQTDRQDQPQQKQQEKNKNETPCI